MKILELLLEYDINKIRQLAPLLDQRTQDDSLPELKSVEQLADYVEKQLGVKSGELVFWILHRYLNKSTQGQYGINRWEDIQSRLIPALEKFTKLKNKKKISPEQRDINKFKSLGQLEDLMDQFPDEELASQKEQASAQEKQYYDSGQAQLIYNDPQIKVVVPKTKEASCYFGTNTRWCTAAQQNNLFASYNKQGPLYMVLIKPENARYQFHWESNQFMDERDQPMNPNQLADKYPVLWKIFQPIAEKNKSLVLNQNPSIQVQMAAVSQDGMAIKYIQNPSPQIQLAAVSNYGKAIQFIKNPSPQVQLAAVSTSGFAIEYIKNPSPQLQLAAVSNYGKAIQFIKNPSPEVQLAAIKKDGWAIQFIKNPSPQLQLAAVSQDGLPIQFIQNPSPQVQLAAVRQNGLAIQYIKNPSPQVQLAAVSNYGWAVMGIQNPSPEVQLAAIRQASGAIRYIQNPSPEVQLAAVRQDGLVIQWIKNPSPEIPLAAVRQNGLAIQFIKKPSPEVQLAAVKENGSAIKLIKKPSPEVQLAAKAK
jgi:hypothetical protein